MVHTHARKALDLLQQNWEHNIDVQQQIYAALDAMETGSAGVMQIIDQMVEEKHHNP